MILKSNADRVCVSAGESQADQAVERLVNTHRQTDKHYFCIPCFFPDHVSPFCSQRISQLMSTLRCELEEKQSFISLLQAVKMEEEKEEKEKKKKVAAYMKRCFTQSL